MKPKSLAQLVLFVLITAMWLKFAWPLMTKEALALGAVGGLVMHWAVTNKGNRNIVLIRPLTSGWRVFIYDMMFVSFLTALAQQAGDVSALLDALKNSVQNLALFLALAGGLALTTRLGGDDMRRTIFLLALLVLGLIGSTTSVTAVEFVKMEATPNPMSGSSAILVDYILHMNGSYYIIYLDDKNDTFSIQLTDGRQISQLNFELVQYIHVVDSQHWHILKYTGSDELVNGTLTEFGGTSVNVAMPVLDITSFHFAGEGTVESRDFVNSTLIIYVTHINFNNPVTDGYEINGIAVSSNDEFKKIFIRSDTDSITFSDSSSHALTGVILVVETKYKVSFSLKDALTGQPLTGVTVKEGSNVLGTIDDGQSLELTKGTHTLVFEKSDYWSVTKTIDVQGDMSVSVELYPSSAAFKLENFPVNISIPENILYTLTFTLSPIDTSATYNTYLSLSGLPDVIEVRKDGSVISPEGGKYYLGDISGPTQISIKFKAGAVGTHGFTLTLTSNDAIMSKTYTTTKQVTYKVEPLPFSVQMPNEWQVGQNELRISESSGQSYLITAVLKDSSGNEVWSDSHAFGPYEAYTFNVKIPKEGSYTLELQWSGQTAVYNVVVNPVISLRTKVLNVSKGGSGAIVLHFKNPSSSVQYYTIKVSGGFLPKEINQSIAVAPYAEKDISVPFAVPDNLQYDAYELKVQVLEGDAVVFQDEVAVSVSGSSGFSLFGGGSGSGKTLYYGLAVLVGLGLFIAILRRR